MTQTAQIQELQGLLDELSAEVAELTETVEAHKADSGYVSSINSGLADLVALLRNRKDPAAPKITVNVSPTPITVEPVVQVIDRPARAFKIHSVIYDRIGRFESATVSPV